MSIQVARTHAPSPAGPMRCRMAICQSSTSTASARIASAARLRMSFTISALARIASSLAHAVVTMHRPRSRSASIDMPTQPLMPWTVGQTSSRQKAIPSSIARGSPRMVVVLAYMPVLLPGDAPAASPQGQRPRAVGVGERARRPERERRVRTVCIPARTQEWIRCAAAHRRPAVPDEVSAADDGQEIPGGRNCPVRSRTRTGDRLAVLAGARLDVLSVAPGARARHVALGGVLVSTGALAALSAAFAVHMTLGAWWAVALLIGLGWGLVILNLDRMLLVGMGHRGSWQRARGMALPRVALAAVLGTVISTPLTLQVFSKEIDATIVTMQAEAAAEFAAGLDADERYAQIPDLQQRIADEQALIAAGGNSDPNTAPAVVTAQAERDAKQAAYDAAQARFAELQAAAQCELDGSCGSGREGTGDAYFAAAAAAQQQASVRDAAQAALDTADTALQQARATAEKDAAAADARAVAIASSDLTSDSAELARLTDARAAEQAAFETQNDESDGILARLEAMSRLQEDRPMVATAHLMLFLLFLSVEVLPVLVKVLLNLAEPAAYDRLVTARDDEEVLAEEIRSQGRLRAQRARADLLVAAETDRMAREIVDRENAAREEAARKAERRARRRRNRIARIVGDVLRPARVEAPEPVAEPTLDTGELEALMLGTATEEDRPFLPAPRSVEDAEFADR